MTITEPFRTQVSGSTRPDAKWEVEAAILLTACLAVLMVALYFVYPASNELFWPHHSDFYVATALSYSNISLWDCLFLPRPVGVIYFKLTGYLGIRGAILANLALVIINCTLTTMLVRRIYDISLKFEFYICGLAYLMLIFTHPFQYVWATYDVFAQLSYFFLLIAAWLVWRRASAVTAFTLLLIAFLAKETFAVSAVILTTAAALAVPKTLRPRLLSLLVAIFFAFAIAFFINLTNGSPFTDSTQKLYGNSYKSNFSPLSISTELIRYFSDSVNPGTAILMAAVILALIFQKSSAVAALIMILAGVCALLPNASIPNHYYPGYSWNSAYLIFAPVLLVAKKNIANAHARTLGIFLLVASTLTPIFSTSYYKKNSWLLEQETRQKKLMHGIGTNIEKIHPQSRSILVSGLNFPFSPFDHGQALQSMGKGTDISKVRFDVIRYDLSSELINTPSPTTGLTNIVNFVTQRDALHRNYDEYWMFATDGSMVVTATVANENTLASADFTARQMILYPSMYEALSNGEASKLVRPLKDQDGYRLLRCGSALVEYMAPELAIRCLEASVKKIPENPYPYFYMGQALLQMRHKNEANRMFIMATERDDSASPNPAFRQAITE